MSGEFLDSNIFVYVFDKTDARKSDIAANLVRRVHAEQTAAISFQVVQETLNVLTRKLKATETQARIFLEHMLLPLWHVMPSVVLYQSALDIQARLQFGFYDSLIIAAALEAGCTRLYSEDMQHGQKIGRLVINNPFRK